MIWRLLGFVFGGKSPLDALTDTYLKYKDSEVESERIRADLARRQIDAEVEHRANQVDVVKAGMQHRIFWVAWGLAALPTAAWHGWGMLDSMLWDGSLLPDVAALPPQLKEYADTVWQNIFYTGGAVAGATGAASVIATAIASRRRG